VTNKRLGYDIATCKVKDDFLDWFQLLSLWASDRIVPDCNYNYNLFVLPDRYQSVNQSKHISVVPYVANQSEVLILCVCVYCICYIIVSVLRMYVTHRRLFIITHCSIPSSTSVALRCWSQSLATFKLRRCSLRWEMSRYHAKSLTTLSAISMLLCKGELASF